MYAKLMCSFGNCFVKHPLDSTLASTYSILDPVLTFRKYSQRFCIFISTAM